MERLNRAKAAAMDRLTRIPGVHTVGIGYKRRDGRVTDELAVIVYVDRKLPREELNPDWLIPSEVRFGHEGEEVAVATDVVERSRAVEYPHLADGSLDDRVRPVPGGRSIEGGLGGGTLGGWVWDDINDQMVLLSNRHVLGTTTGANVYQPWGSTAAADHIADNVRTGTMDATIAAPSDSGIPDAEIEGVGFAVFDTTVGTLGMAVEKSGATTEHTTGTIVAVNLSKPGHIGSDSDFEVDPDAGQARFAYYGDSGSLIVERNPPEDQGAKRVVGLLWGGDPSEGNAYGHPIDDVFADLDLTALCQGTVSNFFDSILDREWVAGPVWPDPPPWRIDRPWAVRQRKPHRGIARDVEEELVRTGRGEKLADLVHRNGIGLTRLVLDPTAMRVLEAAAAPFVSGLWSATELLEREVTDEDVARFDRALTMASERVPELDELVREARSLVESANGTTFRAALGETSSTRSKQKG
jgi:hypothetical protein